MIKNIIFDIGNVILNFDYLKVIANYTDNIKEQRFILDNIINSPEWLGYSLIDTGFITKEEAIQIVQDRTNHVNDNLIHDCLVPWDELSPEIQQYDIDLVKEIPSLVESCGFKIVKNKISLLCLEIIKYQDDEFSLLQTGDFSGNNRYINFIQTNNLIKTLSKRGYSIKDLSDDRKPILEFGVDERDLASRQHEEWCKIKFSLGWNYGSKNDNEEKTSPYLVDWYDLDVSKQNHYINIIRNLPKICNEVGLKIIKN